MADYYTALAQKIQETGDDPVKIRVVVYEAARLALRWQVEEQWPSLSIIQGTSNNDNFFVELIAGASRP